MRAAFLFALALVSPVMAFSTLSPTTSTRLVANTWSNPSRAGLTLLTTVAFNAAGTVAAKDSSGEDKSDEKPSGLKGKAQKLLSGIRTAPYALALVTYIIGYKFGKKAVAKVASTTTDATPIRTSWARQYPIVALLLLVIAGRDLWSVIPEWFKKNIPVVGRRYQSTSVEEDPDDLTSLSALSFKLKNLFQRGQEKLAERGEEEVANPYMVFFATLRLLAQQKTRIAKGRDQRYMDAGKPVDNPRDVLEGMDEMFEFADWAYDEDWKEDESLKTCLRDKGFSLLRHEKVALPGHVAHYVAVSPKRKMALISIKGTSTFEDMLTDCCGRSVTFKLPDGPFIEDGRDEFHCHEGLLLSSRRLADDLQSFVEDVLLPSGYKVLVTGHSLGAGAAALFGILLRSRIKQLRSDNGDKLQVLAFAPPPILDYDASLSCHSFCRSFVNNADIIPRASLSNVVLTAEFMKLVNKRLDERGMGLKDMSSAKAYLKMLMSSGKDGECIMTPEEIKEGFDDTIDQGELRDPDHLYIPGEVVHMFDLWSKKDYGDRSDYEDLKDDDPTPRVPTAEKVHITDGISKPLRNIEIDDRMLSDHMSAGYRASIKYLLEKSKEPVSNSLAPQPAV